MAAANVELAKPNQQQADDSTGGEIVSTGKIKVTVKRTHHHE